MDFLELARNRYSVRKYKKDPVEKEKIDKILEAGRLAPTARNYQPQVIYVIQSKEALEKMKENSPCTFEAPLIFLFGYDREKESYNIDNEDHRGIVDVDIVQTHMMLEAEDLGLGTCWVKMFDQAGTRKAFEIPSNIKLTGIMPCGYKEDGCEPSPAHSASRKLEEMVFYL